MSIASQANTRDERREQLLQMWKTKSGQLAVLSLCHRALPPGDTLQAGMSVVDVILDREFGEPSDDSSFQQDEDSADDSHEENTDDSDEDSTDDSQ